MGKQWQRITHRVLVDFQHRCMRRTAPEEWNLCANYQEHDPTCAEFLRTYRSVDFPGGQLLKRLEAEVESKPVRENYKMLPGDAKWVRCFDDLYGYRGSNELVYLLRAWEFLMHWDIKQLSANGFLASSQLQ